MKRFTVLDEFRAVAVLSMIVAHFAPGFFDRLPAFAGIRDQVIVTGRLATVAFVIVFGLAIGYVYLDKVICGELQRVIAKMRTRSMVVLLCSILFSVPFYINNALSHVDDAGVYLNDTYNVLSYYALALLVLPYLLRYIAASPWRNAMLLGAASWAIGYVLTLVWDAPAQYSIESFFYQWLVGGAYAFFKVTGFAIAQIPLGYHIRKKIAKSGSPILQFTLLLFAAALLMVLLGLYEGIAVGEFTVPAFVAGAIKMPPRLWYWFFVGGICYFILIAFIQFHRHVVMADRIMHPLAVFGRASLPIFTLHTWVLPVVNWTDRVYVVEGIARIFFASLLFVVVAAVSIAYKSRTAQSR